LYSTFSHPTYPQQFGEFVSNLSIVDVLMNRGARETRRLLDIEPATAEKPQRCQSDHKQATSASVG
jgi:hypothetical protein